MPFAPLTIFVLSTSYSATITTLNYFPEKEKEQKPLYDGAMDIG